MAKRILSGCALIDWHNMQRHFSPRFADDPARMLPDALLRIQRALARLLMQIDAAVSYRVVIRIYHGWHEGRAGASLNREPTPLRRTFERLSGDSSLARRISRVSFTTGFQFGNELACDSRWNPLYATYRGGGSDKGQKMVDTAIACDLLHMLRFGFADIGVVVSDDDDLVPAVFMADAWKLRAILLRAPASSLAHISAGDVESIVRYWSSE